MKPQQIRIRLATLNGVKAHIHRKEKEKEQEKENGFTPGERKIKSPKTASDHLTLLAFIALKQACSKLGVNVHNRELNTFDNSW
jgi:hypothetical protein